MLRIGLTGGIASGKTAVTRRFAELGAGVVDTDEVARDVVRPGTPGLAGIEQAFGRDVMTPDGELDRAAMRARVFRDPAERRKLEAILHPLIRSRTIELMALCEAPYVVVAVPLLLETDFGKLVDRVLVVDCPREQQLTRLIARDGISRHDAVAIVDAQIDREQRLAAADDVIDNSGDLDNLTEQVARLHLRYLDLARDCPEQ